MEGHVRGILIHTGGTPYLRSQTVPTFVEKKIVNRKNEIFADNRLINPIVDAGKKVIDLTRETEAAYSIELNNYTGPNILISRKNILGQISESVEVQA